MTFFGEDVNPSGSGTLSSTPLSDQARAKFFTNLKGVGTETFEGIATGTANPAISFPGVGTATLTGGGSVASGASSSDQYPISGTQYYNAGSSSFVITFNKPIAAFGFYGTDIGDFGGQITLTLDKVGGGSTFLTVPNVVDARTANGSALYYGFYDTHIQYTQISFGNTGSGDFFGFDDFSVGSVDQVVPVSSTIGTTGGDIAANVYSLGSAAARASPVTFDGGVLRLTGGAFPDNIITAPVTIKATSGTVDTSTASGGFSGVVSGPGSLTITGGNTFSLTGVNTYAGGTILKQGTLAIGNSAALGIGALTLDNGTTLQFTAPNITLANAVVLPDVDPTIDTGSRTVTMSGSIRGPGALTKIGSGTLDLTGISPYTGNTTVSQGTLLVDGSIARSSVTVQDGALIGGGGTIGALALQNGATFVRSADNTLTVIGNVTFASGASYQVTINGDGTGNKLRVGGTAALGGSALTVLAGSGTFVASTYTLISAAGGLTGTFGTVTTDPSLALLSPTVSYGANAVTLTLRPVDFASIATTPNQRATATAIQALGQGSPLYTAVASQSAPGARQAFASASGTSHADPGNIILTTDRLVATVVLDRLWDIAGNGLSARETLDQFAPDRLPALVRCYGPMPEPVPAAPQRRYTAWGEGFGSFGHNDGTANAGTLDRSLGGFVLGIDAPIHDVLGTSWRVGVAGGYTNSAYRSSIDDGSGTVQGAFGSLYGGARYGDVDVRVGATVGGVFTDARRTVAFPGFREPEASHNDGITGQAFGEIGYRFTKADMVLEPILGASILHVHQDGFTEKGGAAALSVAGQDNDFGTTTLGFRGETTPFSNVPLTAHGLLAWQHTIGDVTPSTVLAFAANPSQSFSVTGTPIDRDALAAEAALDYKASLALDIGLSYTGVIGPTARDHSVKGRFEYRF